MVKKKLPRLVSVDRLAALAHSGRDGAGWYDEARAHADVRSNVLRLAHGINTLDVTRYVELLALFSPRVQVVRNIRITEYYLQHGQIFASETMPAVRAAVRHYESTGKIRGPKTSAFANAILGDTDAVVLDVWMARAFGIDQELFSRIPIHKECCKRIRKAATLVGLRPAETQAAIWYATIWNAGRRPWTWT